jgi:hypothetical protein
MRDVSQISPPIRIVLAAAALFLVAWMTVLKPKSADSTPPTPAPITSGNVATGKPAVSMPGKLAEKAKHAVQQSDNAQAADTGQATPSTTGTAAAPATGTTATGAATGSGTTGSTAAATSAVAADLKGLPSSAVKAILAQKVLVIGFFNGKAADDRAVRRALMHADRWNGRVFVKAAPISKVGDWGRIARGVDVEQSPTIVVVARDLKATTLVGFNDKQAIDQAVIDAMRSAGGLFTSRYLRQVNNLCSRSTGAQLNNPPASTLAQAPGTVKRDRAILARFAADFRSIKAPARFKAFRTATLADLAVTQSAWTGLVRAIGAHPKPAALLTAAVAAEKKAGPAGKRLDARMSKQHLLSCANG